MTPLAWTLVGCIILLCLSHTVFLYGLNHDSSRLEDDEKEQEMWQDTEIWDE